MKLSTQAILNLSSALASLDGYNRVVKDGEREQIMRQPFKFKPGLRAAIAKNLIRLNPTVEAYSKTRDNVIILVSGGKRSIDPDNVEQMTELGRINSLLLAELHEVDLVKIKEEELSLSDNPIPASTMALMAPIMDGDTWATPEAPTFVSVTSAPAVDPMPELAAPTPLANGAVEQVH